MSARLFRWILVLIWMAVIFSASTDEFSARHTSRVILPVLTWFFPHITAAQFAIVHEGIRKSAHIIEYSILGLLLWRAIPEWRERPEVADWTRAGVAILVATCYAATDEYHQTFVPSRGASAHDVMIDGCGATLAVLTICYLTHLKTKNSIAPAPAAQ